MVLTPRFWWYETLLWTKPTIFNLCTVGFSKLGLPPQIIIFSLKSERHQPWEDRHRLKAVTSVIASGWSPFFLCRGVVWWQCKPKVCCMRIWRKLSVLRQKYIAFGYARGAPWLFWLNLRCTQEWHEDFETPRKVALRGRPSKRHYMHLLLRPWSTQSMSLQMRRWRLSWVPWRLPR